MLIQLETTSNIPRPLKLFYSYSHRDEPLREELEVHLALLKKEGFILDWHDRKIQAGAEWQRAIDENLNLADIILFLVSPFFLASSYCRDIEVKRAMERSGKGEAVVVPIILKSCVWSGESFAGLEPLPKTGRPLSEWLDSGFAQVAEDLRVRLLEMSYPRQPDPARAGMHGNWVLKFRTRNGTSAMKAGTLVDILKDISKDYSITLEATARTRLPGGESSAAEMILIMSGSPEAFSAIQKEMNLGRLSGALNVDVISFYIGYGAVVHEGTSPIENSEAHVIETGDLLLRPGRPVETCNLKGIKAKDYDPGSFDFIVDRGDESAEEFGTTGDSAKLLDYFKAALTVKEDNMWVNLSAYEADRMLPQALAGTQLGRDMLAQDVVLKQLTASYMHPDNPVGRQYWREVFKRARKIYGTSRVVLNSFQKVWLVPKKALVYELPVDDPAPEIRERFRVKPGERLAYIVETDLDALCECDLLALKHHAENSAIAGLATDFTTDIFKEIVLPHIHQEVNEGEHFVALRQIYNALILATWVKKKLGGIEAFSRIFKSVNSDNPESLEVTIRNISSLSEEDASITASHPYRDQVCGPRQALDHLTPDAPAFRIADNVEFYEKYVRLFRNGVFRCARSEEGDAPGERISRLYFSGALRFEHIPIEFKTAGQNAWHGAVLARRSGSYHGAERIVARLSAVRRGTEGGGFQNVTAIRLRVEQT